MRKFIFIAITLGFVGFVSYAIVFYKQNLRGIKPVITPPPADIVQIIEKKDQTTDNSVPTDFPLTLPKGFEISIFAKDVPGARVMAFGPKGDMWVSEMTEGKVVVFQQENGKAVKKQEVFINLNKPHGLVFDPQDPYILYIAEADKISKVRIYSDELPQKIVDLNDGGRHTSRTIKFGPDDRLFVSIGSSCDVCHEQNDQRAKIFSMKKDGSDFKEYARGLRNTVFFDWSYVDGKMWGVDMGRDLLGDDLPPDEINILEEGKNYGWPNCYGKNIHDTEFDKNTYIRNPCMEPFEKESYIDLPAHSAPLGLSFVPEEGWPEEYWYNLLVSFHGSWNRTEPTGYKIVRIKLNSKGEYLGTEDFISGWLTKDNKALGRPVDIITQPGGNMYVSDDKAGVIYKIQYVGPRSEKLSDATFEDCVAAGNPVMESYPRQCRMDGQTYVEQIVLNADGVEDTGNELQKINLIRVSSPRPNQKITSPLKITGEARGTWFFEASFPIRLYDSNGNELAVAVAQAKDEWMTNDFVPFEATLEFKAPNEVFGVLKFQKDNPSGLPEHDDALIMPIKF